MAVMHQRTAIRKAVVAALLAGATDAGPRVHDHPGDPLREWPALTVEDFTEQQHAATRQADPARAIERTLVVEVTAVVVQVGDHAAARDQLLAQVETILASVAIPGVKAITPAGYAPQADYTGDRPVSKGRQRFEILYYTPQGNPASAAL